MKYITFIIASIALFGLYEQSVNALPQRNKVQTLLYHPPPTTRAQRPMRARREVEIKGSSQPNLRTGGSDISVGIGGTKIINNKAEEPEHILTGSLEADRNTNIGRPITNTAKVGYENAKHNFGVGISKSQTPGIGEVLKQTAHKNLYNDGNNKLDASIFKDVSTSQGGATHTVKGGTLELSNINGHSIGLDKTIVPGQSETLTQRAHLNFFDNGRNKFDASLFNTKVKFNSDAFGPNRHSYGGDLAWSHMDGFGANVGLSKEPEGNLFNYGGFANLYKTKDERGSFDLKAGGSKWLDGPYSGKHDFNVFGIGSYKF